jgi:octaprenyl-diphosphate synthase
MSERMGDLPVPADIQPLLTFLEARAGKMIRPALVLLAGQCLGAVQDSHLQAAAVMEMIHGATLLHDDVVDRSERRRGAETANHLWGNETAVLLGDFVLTHVLRICVDLDRPVARIVADTAAQVCRGELRQTLDRAASQLDEQRYIEIITDKSAAFFSGCCRIGALLSGGTGAQADALAEYGLQMGIAFQMADDLIDVSGCEAKAGKPVGQDINSHLTLPVIHWIASLDSGERSEIKLTDPIWLVEQLKRTGSIDYVREKCAIATKAAIAALDDLQDSEFRTALIDLARYAGDRSS